MTQPGTTRRAGYTLVEILIVVVIMAIVAAVVVPSIGTAGDSQASSAIRVVQSDLDLARSTALTTGQPCAMVFSNDLKSYKIVANYAGGGGDYSTVTAIDDPVSANKKRDVTLNKMNNMSAVTISNLSLGGKTYVKFMSQGDPEVGGTVTVASHGQAWTITIQSLTGFMTVTKTAG
jgi:type II secretion system protein H